MSLIPGELPPPSTQARVDYNGLAEIAKASPGQWFRLEVTPALSDNAAYSRGKQFMRRGLTVVYREPAALPVDVSYEPVAHQKAWRRRHKDLWLCFKPATTTPTATQETS